MVALREVQEVTSRSVTVTLPEYFQAKKVEIIILPVEEADNLVENDAELDAQRLSLQALLLSAPTLTDEEVEEFTKIRDWINEWRVKEF